MATKAELQEQAVALGLEVDARWSKADLSAAIDQAQTPVAEVVKPITTARRNWVKNTSSQRWMAFDKALAPGEIYQPTKQDLSSERAVAKINRAVELGKLEWC